MGLNVRTAETLAQKIGGWTKGFSKQSILETKVVKANCFESMTFPGIKPLPQDTLTLSVNKTAAEVFEKLMERKLDIGTAQNA